jgi:hypothetical protein
MATFATEMSCCSHCNFQNWEHHDHNMLNPFFCICMMDTNWRVSGFREPQFQARNTTFNPFDLVSKSSMLNSNLQKILVVSFDSIMLNLLPKSLNKKPSKTSIPCCLNKKRNGESSESLRSSDTFVRLGDSDWYLQMVYQGLKTW